MDLTSLQNVVNQIPGQESAVVAVGAIGLEFAMRLWPTRNPAGLIHMIAGGARIVALGLSKVADLLDKILPQKTK